MKSCIIIKDLRDLYIEERAKKVSFSMESIIFAKPYKIKCFWFNFYLYFNSGKKSRFGYQNVGWSPGNHEIFLKRVFFFFKNNFYLSQCCPGKFRCFNLKSVKIFEKSDRAGNFRWSRLFFDKFVRRLLCNPFFITFYSSKYKHPIRLWILDWTYFIRSFIMFLLCVFKCRGSKAPK